MPADAVNDPNARHDGWLTLKRFLPYLRPRDNPALRRRIVIASVLILLSIGTQLALPYLLQWAVDAMSTGAAASLGGQWPTFVMLTGTGYAQAIPWRGVR